MKKTLFLLAALCFSIGYAAEAKKNAALGKKYKLSTSPNYKLCSDPDDSIQLTDGKFAKETIWVDKATVGWHGQSKVSVTVDLEKEETISGASYSSGAGASGVKFPEAIFVYASSDSKTWAYLGDLTDSDEARATIKRKGYHPFKFKSEQLKGKGRYVRFDVMVKGYAFCDELEIYTSPTAIEAVKPTITDIVKHSKMQLLRKTSPELIEDNIAPQKHYTLSPAPNYKLCTDTEDTIQLTDGKFAKKTIWVDKATVGWHGQSLVSVTVDLEKEEPISGACWSTGAGTSGVPFPQAIFVYASQDGKTWAYLGDLTDSNSAIAAIKRKGYHVFKFKSNKLKGKGRYVKFDILTTGYVFGDELEIYRSAFPVQAETPSITDTPKYSKELLLKKKASKPAGANIALGKNYTYSPAPNYWHSTDPDDILQLTDGNYTRGDFWTQKSTVGWSYHNVIDVTVDLENMESISGFSWNSAAGRAQVEFPSSICVYVSADKKTWDYAGDLVVLGTKNKKPAKGYNVFKFAANGLKLRGRYVKFYLITNTQYVFGDEIEVLKGDDKLVPAPAASGITNIQNHALAQFFHGPIVQRCQNDLSALQKQLATLPAATKSKAEQQVKALSEAILTIRPVANVKEFKAIIPLNEVHSNILGLNAYILQQAGYTKPFFWNSGRWDPLTITAIPPKAALQPLTIDMMRKEVRSDVINICNPTNKPVTYTISVKGLSSQANIVLKEVLFTDTRKNEVVASALKPAGLNQSLSTVVPAGCNRQIWVSIQKPELKAGSYKATITATAKNAPELKANLVLNIRNLDFPARPTLHTGGWDYLNKRSKAEAAMHQRFMSEELYVDSAWGDPYAVPWTLTPAQYKKADKNGNLIAPDKINFSKWDEWVSTWKGARFYCIFWGVGHSFGGFDKNTPQFKKALGQYLKCWADHARKQGINPSQILILIFDEPRAKAHYDITIKWGEAIRASGTGFQIYSDPIPKNFSDVPPKMLDYIDVFCPNSASIPSRPDIVDVIKRQRKNGHTIWLYACSGPAKQLDPITYHRLQAWRTFSYQGEGSFFWQMGCTGGSGSNFWPYNQSGTDYSPYFSTPTEILHGKQSEACREGVEDFEYLTMLKKKIASSDKATAAKLQKILDEAVQSALSIQTANAFQWSVPKNRAAVDQARLKILEALK